MTEKSTLTIFDYIREINKLPSDILSPAKFKILVEIAMRLNETSSTWPKNKDLSINTAIKPNSIKVLLSQLKKDNFINIEKNNGKRNIFLCHPTEKKRLMVINQNGKKLMVINQKVNGDLPPYIKEKENKNIKEKLGAVPDSYNIWHPYIDEIMNAIPDNAKGKLSRAFINEHLKKKKGNKQYFYWLFNHADDKPNPVKWLANGIRGYYAAYLKSEEYQVAGAIAEFKSMGRI